MAVKRLELSLPDSRKSVAMREDPTRVDPRKLKLAGFETSIHDPDQVRVLRWEPIPELFRPGSFNHL